MEHNLSIAVSVVYNIGLFTSGCLALILVLAYWYIIIPAVGAIYAGWSGFIFGLGVSAILFLAVMILAE